MLQGIRDYTQGWIAGVIISILILSFALWGVHSYVGGSSNTSAATVNGTEISREQLALAYERLHRQLQMQSNSNYQLPPQAETELKNRSLQALINIQVLKQASIHEDYRITSRQVDGFLQNMPEFQVNGQFSAARFQQILQTTLYNASDFLELIKTSLLIDQPRLGLIFTSYALPNEIKNTISLVNQERDVQFATIPFKIIPKSSIQIPQDKIHSYYIQHQDEFKTPEQVSISFVELSLKDLLGNIQPNEDVLKKYYTENSSSYTLPKQWKFDTILVPLNEIPSDIDISEAENKAKEIIKQANNKKSFADLIHQFIVEKGSDKLQGWVTLNQIPTELQKSALSLTKVNQISNPIRTARGFMILRVLEIKEPVVQTYPQVKDKIKDAFVRQQAEEKFASMKDQLANISYEHPDSLDATAKALGLSIKTTALFTKDKGLKDITSNNSVREAAFNNDVLNLRNNSDVIQIAGEHVAVIRIKSHSPATLLTLDTVKNQIIDKLTTLEINLKTEQLAKEVTNNLQKAGDLTKIAAQYHLTWNSLGFIGRRANKIDSAITEAAFAMPKPATSKYSFATTKIPDGFVVLVLKGVRDGAVANHDQYQVFAEQIQNTQGLMEYELYKQSLMQSAKIEFSN